MSAPRFALEVTDLHAATSLTSSLYSLDTWGEDLAIDYQADLDCALDTIRGQPQMGTPHPEIGQGVRILCDQKTWIESTQGAEAHVP